MPEAGAFLVEPGPDASANTDANGQPQNNADRVTGADSDTGNTARGDITTGPTSWKSIVIYDKYTEPACTATASPGPDIDAVALWRNIGGLWKLMGVGKVGSADYTAAANPPCQNNQHAEADDIAAVCGPLGDIDGQNISSGYLGLGGGSVELTIGACQSDFETVGTCDGKGAPVEILQGDEIDVYEVDGWYLENGPGGSKADGATPYITGACKCLSETYEVAVRKEAGTWGTDDKSIGEKHGTATFVVK